MSILVVAAAGIIALVEQSKVQPNPIIMIGAIGVFMLGMYKLIYSTNPFISIKYQTIQNTTKAKSTNFELFQNYK